MSIKDPLLTAYWIKPAEADHGLGYGVTAYSLEDAMSLLKEARITFNPATATVRENVQPEQMDAKHIAPNAGPTVWRGVWYPRLNL
ncbi:MAG TPA: hypothetical protein VKX49_02905 [Bryobacteraceae bacterium]|nr:hypothetical protein [Bryobacteraceae bacterium]